MSDATFEFPDDLKKATVKLEFGHTIFALLDRDGVEIAAGFRETSDVSPEEWYGMYLFGPEAAAELRQKGVAKYVLENMLEIELARGSGDCLDAIVIGCDDAFPAFAEGLIVDNRLELVEIAREDAEPVQLYLGRILLNGRVWKLLVQDQPNVLNSEFPACLVDRDLNILT